MRISDDLLDFVVRVDAMHYAFVVHDAVGMGGRKGHISKEVAAGIVHVEPDRKEHVDLMDVLLQR